MNIWNISGDEREYSKRSIWKENGAKNVSAMMKNIIVQIWELIQSLSNII